MQITGFELRNVIFISTLVPYPGKLPTREHGQLSEIAFRSVSERIFAASGPRDTDTMKYSVKGQSSAS
jgi:hypothetical protein